MDRTVGQMDEWMQTTSWMFFPCIIDWIYNVSQRLRNWRLGPQCISVQRWDFSEWVDHESSDSSDGFLIWWHYWRSHSWPEEGHKEHGGGGLYLDPGTSCPSTSCPPKGKLPGYHLVLPTIMFTLTWDPQQSSQITIRWDIWNREPK